MKKWNAPEIKALNLSNTELGQPEGNHRDFVFHAVINGRNANLYSYSGVEEERGPEGDVTIH